MNKDIYRTLLALLALVFTACVSEVDAPPSEGGGRLQLSLVNISTATSRVTPVEIGKPLASNLHLTITNVVGRAVYDDVFTEDELTLPVGDYGVKVTYGSNVFMAVDAPYYLGETQVTVEEDKTTEASITAKVANALVSVHFGADATEQARFDRFYSDYAVQVFVDNYYMSISKDEPDQSIYVRDGSHVTLRFWGKLKMEDGREVSMDLTSDDLPETLSAADHLIVTLGLPDPASDLTPDITKAEVETVTLDETIPLSWLPVPQVTSANQYDNGNLVGTDLTFVNSYPGMKWKVEVTKATGETTGEKVREVVFEGSYEPDYLVHYTSSTDCPYLPRGTYKATYYLAAEDGTWNKTSSREFRINQIPQLTATLDGYTPYDKYLDEDIDAANEEGPDGNAGFYGRKIREITARLKVADNIINNSKYASLKSNMTANVDGSALSGTATGNSFHLAYTPDLSRAQHTVSVSGSFDGGTATASKSFEVTGIPYLANSEATFSDWTAQVKGQWAADTPDNSVTAMTDKPDPSTCYWFKGNSSGSDPANIYSPEFYIPSNINISTQFLFWYYVPSKSIAQSDENKYFYYGLTPDANSTPNTVRATPEPGDWVTIDHNFTFTPTLKYLSIQWHRDEYKLLLISYPGWYWWCINNVKILYR